MKNMETGQEYKIITNMSKSKHFHSIAVEKSNCAINHIKALGLLHKDRKGVYSS